MSIIDNILHFFDEEEEIPKYTVEYLRWNIELTDEDDFDDLKEIVSRFEVESYCMVPEYGIWMAWKLPVDFDFELLLVELNRKRFTINEEYIKR